WTPCARRPRCTTTSNFPEDTCQPASSGAATRSSKADLDAFSILITLKPRRISGETGSGHESKASIATVHCYRSRVHRKLPPACCVGSWEQPFQALKIWQANSRRHLAPFRLVTSSSVLAAFRQLWRKCRLAEYKRTR